MIKFYEPAIEEEEPIGEYCPSVDNDPPMEPKPPFKPLWKTRKTSDGRAHYLPGKTFYTGSSPGINGPIKYAGIDVSPPPGKFEPCLICTRRSVAEFFRYLRKEARNGH